jgi:hypothetical protein
MVNLANHFFIDLVPKKGNFAYWVGCGEKLILMQYASLARFSELARLKRASERYCPARNNGIPFSFC